MHLKYRDIIRKEHSMKQEFLIDNWNNCIDIDTKIHRYMSFEDFVGLIETKKLNFTRIISWEDTWEAPIRNLPRQFDDDNLHYPSYSREQEYFGQCWTTLKDSDAMWRIYSHDRKGIKISSSISKFSKLENPRVLFCAPVYYYNDLEDALSFALNTVGRESISRDGYIKRDSFKHEQEIRFLFLDKYPMTNNYESEKSNYYKIEIDPFDLIEEIELDPRSSEYYLSIVVEYCKRAGFDIKPHKSELYTSNPSNDSNIVIRWKSK